MERVRSFIESMRGQEPLEETPEGDSLAFYRARALMLDI
jgi:hypothetical protein